MGGKSSSTTTKSAPWKDAQPHLRKIMGDAEQFYDDGTFRVDPYSGQRVASQSSATLSGLEGLAGGTQAGGIAMDAYRDMMDPNKYRSQLDTIKSGIIDDTNAALAGMFSGGRTTNSLASPAASKAMTNALATHEYGALQDFENRRAQGISMAPQMQQTEMFDANNALKSGMMQDAYNQSLIDADMQKYYETENMDADALSKYSAFAQGIGGMGGSGSTTQSQNPGMMGTLGGLFQIGSLFSDRDLKENIRRVGQTDSGIPVYTYNYKGSEITHMGVMADEVPHAVTGEINGFKTVDYARVH